MLTATEDGLAQPFPTTDDVENAGEAEDAACEEGVKGAELQGSCANLRPRRRLVLFTLAVALLLLAVWQLVVRWTTQGAASRAFDAFVLDHRRVYASVEQRAVRQAIFTANYEFIQSENARGHSYTLAVNAFADLTSEEFRASHLGLSVVEATVRPWSGLPYLGRYNVTTGEQPDEVDWVKKGAVTDPKSQGGCGSCWSFSTTGALEGAWQIATGTLVSLSEQQLVDCNKENNACGGGSMDPAFAYLQDRVVCTEASYPYEGKSGLCRESNCSEGIPKGRVTGYQDVAPGDAAALKGAVSRQPVSIGIEADQQVFQFYNGGIITKPCGSKLDHGVLLVGYGSDGGVDYWKVKNSWGAAWGEGGYIRMARAVTKTDSDGGEGECGILSMPSYPVVDGHGAQEEAVTV